MYFILLLICISYVSCVNCYGYCKNEYINVVGKDGTEYTILRQEHNANLNNMLRILNMCMQKENDVNPNKYYIIKDIEPIEYHVRQQFIEEYRKSHESNEDFNCSEVIHTFKKIYYYEVKDPVIIVIVFLLLIGFISVVIVYNCISFLIN